MRRMTCARIVRTTKRESAFLPKKRMNMTDRCLPDAGLLSAVGSDGRNLRVSWRSAFCPRANAKRSAGTASGRRFAALLLKNAKLQRLAGKRAADFYEYAISLENACIDSYSGSADMTDAFCRAHTAVLFYMPMVKEAVCRQPALPSSHPQARGSTAPLQCGLCAGRTCRFSTVRCPRRW